MSEVQRYELSGMGGGYSMEEIECGEWVRYEDYVALQQQVNQLAAENVRLANSRKLLGEFIIEELDADYPLNLKCETPHTDAFLLNAQADGLDKFAKESYALNRLHFDRRDREAAIAADSRGMMASLFADDLRAQATALQQKEGN